MNRLALILASACLIFGTTASAADFGADRHVARGLECASCHGPDMKNPETPDEKTNSRRNPNPHKAPHNGDCTLCHLQHEPEENYCAQCHKFDFKVKH